MTSVKLPDAWVARTVDGFDDLFSDAARSADIDPALMELMAADVRPIIDSSVSRGLVLLAAFMESIDPEPVRFDPKKLRIPFSADDVVPTMLAASLALLEQPRPPGTIRDLQSALDATSARWIAKSALVELPVGPGVVTREVESVHPSVLKHPCDVLVVTYYMLPVEEPDMVLTAIFRTPSLGFASEFDEQFAAIAAGIEMVAVDGSESSALD